MYIMRNCILNKKCERIFQDRYKFKYSYPFCLRQNLKKSITSGYKILWQITPDS